MAARGLAVVVLAAGQGTRMKSARPKVLHNLAGRPMIGHVLDAAKSLRPAETVVVLAPGMDQVAAAVAPARIAIQKKPLGTADALKSARAALKGFSGDVVVIYGDTPLLAAPTMRNLVKALRRAPTIAVAALGMRSAEPGAYGRLVTDAKGDLLEIVEAEDAGAEQRRIGFCNSGMMAIAGGIVWALLDKIGNDNAKDEFYLTDIVKIARAAGLRAVATEGPAGELLGINTRSELAAAEAAMQRRLRAAAMENGAMLIAPETVHLAWDTRLGRDSVIGPYVVFGPGARVADNAVIRPFCHIEGAAIGKGAVIGPFARLRPGSRIGTEARIGNFVETKNSRLAPGAKANHLTYLGDARVGRDANVGAGTITCNYDGIDKFETVIGPGAFIGSNTALVAPVAIGRGAVVAAGSVITENVAAGDLAVARARQQKIRGWAKSRAKRKKKHAKPAAKAKHG